MDFFEAQGKARSLSRRLVLLFALAVTLMIVGVYLVAVVALGVGGAQAGPDGAVAEPELFQPGLFGMVAVGMLLVIGAGSAFRTAQLRKGGSAVAELLGGRRVDPGSTDPLERRLLNVVEEMSIASGIPVPAVYVLDGESGINAFAAGHTIHDAAVAITRGGLETFTRDELQGVMAHEFSHVLNGDMQLNLRLMGVLFGILLLTVIGRGVLHGSYVGGARRRGGKGGGGGQIMLLGIALIILGYLGVLFGRLIQAAVSRQREFLADAAAVQFTRNPDGISGALRKIGGGAAGSKLEDHHAQEAGHLFFSDGIKGAFSRSFATHPPLEERIERVDPGWDGTYLEPKPASVGGEVEQGTKHRGREGASGGGGAGAGSGEGTFPLPFPVPGLPERGTGLAAAVAAAGTLDAGHLSQARSILEKIPEDVRTATRTAEGAVAVVVALLLSDQDDVRARQEATVEDVLGEETLERARALAMGLRSAGGEARLPLLELCLPSLRSLDTTRGDAVRDVVGPLTRADGKVHAFDFAVFHLLRRALPGGNPSRTARVGPGLSRRRDDAAALLSAVAWAGADEHERADVAFRAGAARFDPRTTASMSLQPATGLDLDYVDAALGRLETLPPTDRRTLLDALEHTVRSDREVTVEELELLRAVAEALDVPMPPVAVTEKGPQPDEVRDMSGERTNLDGPGGASE
ncbi:MAG: M48 family metallopeptidase [Gemmatimonadota bacterium]|nr:M48 family metallopeptidase [Gemmatimonadota bacterium]